MKTKQWKKPVVRSMEERDLLKKLAAKAESVAFNVDHTQHTQNGG